MEIHEAPNKLQVRHHNAITNARHELSAVQLDIYFMLLSRLKPGDGVATKYMISVREIESLTGRQWNYKQLREATAGLIGKVFEIEEEDGLLQVSLMSSAKYLKGQGTIQLSIAEELKPYLIDLKSNFTSFQLFCVLSMTSKYAKWMYVQFSRWKDIGHLSFEVEKLRVLLNLKDPNGTHPEQYKQWGQFKDNVLEPSIKQINEHTDLRIAYTIEKQGKAINRLNFIIKSVAQFQAVIPFETTDESADDARLRERLRDIGILDTKLIRKVLDSTELRKKANKCLHDISLRRKDISSPGGYFRTTLGI